MADHCVAVEIVEHYGVLAVEHYSELDGVVRAAAATHSLIARVLYFVLVLLAAWQTTVLPLKHSGPQHSGFIVSLPLNTMVNVTMEGDVRCCNTHFDATVLHFVLVLLAAWQTTVMSLKHSGYRNTIVSVSLITMVSLPLNTMVSLSLNTRVNVTEGYGPLLQHTV